MYIQEMLESMKKVAAAREANAVLEPRRMTADEKDALLATYHPDYKQSEFAALQMGPNKGEKVPLELAALLQANSRINPDAIDLSKPDYEVDVLVIGGGGAGSSAAIEAHEAGANVMICLLYTSLTDHEMELLHKSADCLKEVINGLTF